MWLTVDSASQPMPGQTEIGDMSWIKTEGGNAFLAVIDGLGHGHEAALAAARCHEALESSWREGLQAQVRHCHEALRSTRGVALSLASIDWQAGRLRWSGVGNVEGVFLHGPARERLLLKSGIVGYNLPEPRVSELQAGAGDTLIFATDGISADFTRNIDVGQDAETLAWSILRAHSRGTDDALVLVCRLHE